MSTKKKDPYWDTDVNLKTDSRVWDAFSTAQDRFARSRRVMFRGRKLTKQAVFGAMCLWADDQDAETLERLLGPYVTVLEKMIDEKVRREGAPTREVSGASEIYRKTSPATDPAVPTRKGKPRKIS